MPIPFDGDLGHLIGIVCHGCWAAAGSIGNSKLPTFRVQLAAGTHTGSVLTILGKHTHQKRGKPLDGILLIMVERPIGATGGTMARLRLIHATIHHIYDAIPLPPNHTLLWLQRASGMVLHMPPKAVPKCLLYDPNAAGGFG